MRFRFPPALALILLSPAIGELLSGSSPPVEFLNPIVLGMLVALYGGGALLVRELNLRWGKGKASLLVLGAAYGIIEEALMVKSFFNPAWPDLGVLGEYGRWLGVNWVWAFFLTLYHAVFSITIPILLVELAYPDQRRSPWVGRKGLLTAGIAFVGIVLVGLVFFPYTPGPVEYLFFLLVVLALLWVARRLPADFASGGGRPMRRPLFLWAYGLAGATLLFLGMFLGAFILPHPALVIVVGSAVLLLYADRLRRYAWTQAEDTHKLALVAGGLSFLVLLAFLQEMDASRPDNPLGMSVVGATFGLILLWLWRRVALRERALKLAEPLGA